jgi:hypothetical protein
MEEKIELEKGCVYFFRHIGLTPVKIGYSSSNSPIARFEQFKTYAPYGSEIIGFIQSIEAKSLETKLHRKYASLRLSGEWFDLTEEQVNFEIDFHTSIEDVAERNEFQKAWAFSLLESKNKVQKQIEDIKIVNPFGYFKSIYLANKKINRSHAAEKLNVSRQTICRWIKIIEEGVVVLK